MPTRMLLFHLNFYKCYLYFSESVQFNQIQNLELQVLVNKHNFSSFIFLQH